MRSWIARTLLAGFVGTLVMTLMMYYVAPMMLGHPMDIAAMLGSVMGGSRVIGMMMHFVLGTVIFPEMYAGLLYRYLPGAPWLRGVQWALVLWLLAQVMVMPMMGAGFFSSHAGGMMAVMASLLGHLVYGALLGGIAANLPECACSPVPQSAA